MVDVEAPWILDALVVFVIAAILVGVVRLTLCATGGRVIGMTGW